ncbi:hypothetical protein OUZ56_012245 [Daphnia magna]|uniref:Uncharacterized protein n=1 Tax=Daphnia magna TaxID=35525 RepID=A0ABQ9Z2F5_9CRUS|nr:hypothetical protein OUZ56_012245 [Daphnia magna]
MVFMVNEFVLEVNYVEKHNTTTRRVLFIQYKQLKWRNNDGVSPKLGINMDPLKEFNGCRLAKEEQNGTGRKLSSQKFPFRAVVGLRP